ncbi:MAG: hypothetical protein ACYTGX_11885 [Planctomycetota bacterium]|jgi:hypothetical protein
METTRRTLGIATCVSGAVYAALLIVLALWAFGSPREAPIRSPYLLLLGAPLLGGTLAWTGYALMRNSPWVHPASTLAAGAAAGLVLSAFALELTWRWQNPLEQTGGPPLEIWPTFAFLLWPAAQTVVVRLFGPRKGAKD